MREQVGGLLAWSGRRGASTGARGRLEAVGGAASTVGCSARRSRARLWLASVAFPRPRVPTCVWRLQEVWAKVLGSIGCSGKLRGDKETKREGGIHCPEKKNGVPPFIIASSGRKASRC